MDSFRTPERVKAVIKKTRHGKEVPIYLIVSVIGLIAFFIIMYNTLNENGLDLIKGVLRDIGITEDAPNFSDVLLMFLLAISFISGIGGIIGLLILMIFSYYSLYASEMSYGIRVSENNFPEIYRKVKEYTMLLGLKKEPRVFVRQMNGQINAFTSWVPGKTFIQLNAEIVDLGYMENNDFETVYFIMAHEFGHIYLHHVQLYYNIWPVLVSYIPVIGRTVLFSLLQRSREYSADRVGQALTNEAEQLDGMMMLTAGRHAYKYMDPVEYMNEIMAKHNFVERFARFVINLLASHPIMPYRVRAIMDPQRKSGKLL